jgi:glycosyltransferase involved in cell wall biosynthesis
MTLTVWQLDPANLSPYYSLAVCDALAQAGCTVRYITTPFIYDQNMTIPDSFQTEYVYFKGITHPKLLHYPRIRRGLRALSYPLGHWGTLRRIKRERPDVVHIQWSRLPSMDIRLVRGIQELGIPVVHTVHDVVPLYAAESGTDRLGNIYRTVDKLIVHTQTNVTDLLAVYPDINRERIAVVPHLEIANHNTPPHASKSTARQHLGLAMDAPVFLFFGSIRSYKGVDILIEAFQKASQARPDLQLVIAGKADPLEKAKLPALDALQSLPNVRLDEGFIPDADLWAYYMAADVLVYPYRHIYQSGALIAGMGYDRAVIVTDVGGMPETVDGNGWIVPPEDVDALAGAMVEAASDMPRLEQMGRRSRGIINQQCAGPVVARQFIDVYQSLLE